MTDEKIDLFSLNKAEYTAPREPRLVDIDSAWFLSIDGCGHPSEPAFQEALEALYTVAFTLKMESKRAGHDYSVCKLEGLWHLGPGYLDFNTAPHSAWNWTLLIRTPDFISENDLRRVQASLLEKGKPKTVKWVGLIGFTEGPCVQMLHVGPYDKEGPALAAMHAFLTGRGLCVVGRHHEIYLSDPRRTPPEKLRTIIRLPVM